MSNYASVGWAADKHDVRVGDETGDCRAKHGCSTIMIELVELRRPAIRAAATRPAAFVTRRASRVPSESAPRCAASATQRSL